MRQRRDGPPRDADPPPPPEPLQVPVVDTHCHLDLIEAEVADTVAAAVAVGVRRMLTIGVDVATSAWAAQTAAGHAEVAAAVAIHPNEAGAATSEALAEIARLAALPEVRAVGETGLDYYRDSAAVADQQRSFREHIAIARQAGKALVIHDREAHADVLAILDEEGPPERVVFHCFSGDAQLAAECARRGYLMSFAGNVTFKNAADLREAVAAAPLELLLVETDAPFLTPMPHRGRPNAPYLTPLTVRALAEVKSITEDAMAHALGRNAEAAFGSW